MTRLTTAALLGCLFSIFPQAASAAPCAGNDATELLGGCSALGSADFNVQLFLADGADGSSDAAVRAALDTVLVFVHGYSVTDTALPEVLFEDGNSGALEDLLASGVSILSMAPGNSPDDRVEDDAQAFRHALELLGAYRNAEAGQLVVLGHSMGGLVARIALAGMEADAVDHNVGLYISYDSPHRGVNVPQGVQHLWAQIEQWAELTGDDYRRAHSGWDGVLSFVGEEEFLSKVRSVPQMLDRTGVPDPTSLQAQQMTMHGAIPGLEDAYPKFMQRLDEVGFPALRKIAVTNGNTAGQGHIPTMGPGGKIFSLQASIGWSVQFVTGKFGIYRDAPTKLSAYNSQTWHGTCGLFCSTEFVGPKFEDYTPDNALLNGSLDQLSGGNLNYGKLMAAGATAAKNDGLFLDPTCSSCDKKFIVDGPDSPFPFVPTSSALALPVTTPDSDIGNVVAAGGTVFDRVFAVGDLPAFPANIDHNTLVLQDDLLEEINGVLLDGAVVDPPTGGNDCGLLMGAQALAPGESVDSCDGRSTLVMQHDGNLVLYHQGTASWSSGTWGSTPLAAIMQGDGNFVLYDVASKPLWNSQTWDSPGAFLAVQDDGIAVVHAEDGTVLWSTADSSLPFNRPSECGFLKGDQGLAPGESVNSCNGLSTLVMQHDGNLVLYRRGTATWSSRTWGTTAAAAIMQADGNLVVYDVDSKPLWNSGTWGSSGALLAVQDDGDLVIYANDGKVLWSTNTWER